MPYKFNPFTGKMDLVNASSSGGGGITSGWELIEEEVVAGSAVTTVTFSSLDGDDDCMYKLISMFIPNDGGSVTYYLRPNGSAVTTRYQYTTSKSGVVSSGGGPHTSLGFRIGITEANNAWNFSSSESLLYAKSGPYRFIHTEFTNSDSTTTLYNYSEKGFWADTSTNITSLEIRAGTASGIGVGSYFLLFKRTNNL